MLVLIMTKAKLLLWWIFFSALTFALMYFVVYTRITFNSLTLELSGRTLSSFGVFFSNILNVALFSAGIGLVLALITSIKFKKKKLNTH